MPVLTTTYLPPERGVNAIPWMEKLAMITAGECPECGHETVHTESGCTHAATYLLPDGSWDLSGMASLCRCTLRHRYPPRYTEVIRFGLAKARALAVGRVKRAEVRRIWRQGMEA